MIVDVKALIGSGDKVAAFTLPFLLVGVILNVMMPRYLASVALRLLSEWFPLSP